MITRYKKLKIPIVVLHFLCETIISKRILLIHVFYRNTMQKKLLLLFMAVNCVMVQASESDVNGVDNIVEPNKYSNYSAELNSRYKQALVDSLSGNDVEAISVLFGLIEKENRQEEADKRYGQCDCSHPFGGPVNSKTGRKFQKFENARIEKNKINAICKTVFTTHKQAVEKEVIEATVDELTLKSNTMISYYKTLTRCGGNDQDCLRKGGVIWNVIISSDYLEAFCSAVYDPVVELVGKKGIPLTQEQIVAIAKKNPKTIALVARLADEKKEVENKLDEILNPKKENEASIFDDLKTETGEEA